MAVTDVLADQPLERHGPFTVLKHLSERTSLRTKLITAVLGLVALALAAISVASVWLLSSYLTTQYDSQLKSAFRDIVNSNIVGTAGLAYPLGSDLAAGVQPPGTQLTWRGGGNNLLPGSSFSQQQPLPSLPAGTAWAGSSPSGLYVTVPAVSGPDSWRVLATTITYPVTDSSGNTEQETCTLVVIRDLGNISATMTRVILFDVLVSAAIIAVLAVAATAVVRANLRPLNDIELTAGQIAAGHLDHRVPEGDARTEVGSLGRSLNAMLTQIETAFHAQQESEQAAHRSEERMRRFIADASHELRTPLTTIRGFAAHYRQRGGARDRDARVPVPDSAGLAGGRDSVSRTDSASPPPFDSAPGGAAQDGLSAEELDHLMGRVESEAIRMGLLVEDLLTLARLDQQRPLTIAPVDLLTLAADAVQDARIISPGRPVSLSVAPGTAFLVDGDEARLRQVIGNLVNNALTHTPAGTPVRVKISRGTLEPGKAGGGAGGPRVNGPAAEPRAGAAEVPAVVLDVEDDGPGMTADQAQRVFERFYRADAARNRASGGTGLGLAIVAGLVGAHGGTVSVRTAPGQGADFQVKLPLSPDVLAADEPDDDLPA
jgi:two-component system, OmpR family, sensor kinase